jgi:hypothetical protein
MTTSRFAVSNWPGLSILGGAIASSLSFLVLSISIAFIWVGSPFTDEALDVIYGLIILVAITGALAGALAALFRRNGGGPIASVALATLLVFAALVLAFVTEDNDGSGLVFVFFPLPACVGAAVGWRNASGMSDTSHERRRAFSIGIGCRVVVIICAALLYEIRSTAEGRSGLDPLVTPFVVSASIVGWIVYEAAVGLRRFLQVKTAPLWILAVWLVRPFIRNITHVIWLFFRSDSPEFYYEWYSSLRSWFPVISSFAWSELAEIVLLLALVRFLVRPLNDRQSVNAATS